MTSEREGCNDYLGQSIMAACGLFGTLEVYRLGTGSAVDKGATRQKRPRSSRTRGSRPAADLGTRA